MSKRQVWVVEWKTRRARYWNPMPGNVFQMLRTARARVREITSNYKGVCVFRVSRYEAVSEKKAKPHE